MPRMSILSTVEREEFEAPPQFTLAQQQHHFDPPLEVIHTLKRFKSPTNQVYFLVSYGYFRATARFFPSAQFRATDLAYVTQILGWGAKPFHLATYSAETQSRHRQLIRKLCQFRCYDRMARKMIITEIRTLTTVHWDPRQIFFRVVDRLQAARIEIPGAIYLSRLIATAVTQRQMVFAQRVHTHLTATLREALQALLTPSLKTAGHDYYHLSQLKRLSQSTKPTKVRVRLNNLAQIRALYHLVAPLLPVLELPPAGITYYAEMAMKHDVYDLKRRAAPVRYLYLLAFVVHHYCRLHDNLVDVFLHVLPSTVNSVRREHMETCYATRATQSRSLTALLTILETDVLTAFKTIRHIAESSTLNDREKIRQIRGIFATHQTSPHQLTEAITPLKASVEETQATYYTALETRSLRLQARLMPILRSLPWQGTDRALLAAIDSMQRHPTDLGHKALMGFLTPAERKAVSPPNRPFRISLYKAFLFIHVGQGLKAGTLFLEQSYKYRALEGYLINRHDWRQDRSSYVQHAQLEAFADPQAVLGQLEASLHEQFVTTNTRLSQHHNEFVSQKTNTNLLVKTPAQPTSQTAALSSFFPGRHYVALTEILATVNHLTHFLSEFKHGHQHPREARPPIRTFLAGMVGLGCGIGVRKLARISRHVQEGQVEHTVQWYFTSNNLRAANDGILQMVDRLLLPTVYHRAADTRQTSSDGQKFEVPAESLNANFSYKYFGKEQGVSVYSFIDERHLLFYSTVMSAGERESTYVLDGLVHQNSEPNHMHSTDTHGYSELIFGLMHLLGLTYAPRIKNFQRQRLYAFKGLRKQEAYTSFLVKPHGTVNTQLIYTHWEDILRFIATLKLRVTTPSELFRRLNSYSSQHGLYRALKAFGQILKSHFLLRYLDDVELRQQITQQLNKVEQSHRLARALSMGTSREFLSVEKEDQEVEEGCKRLIKNAVTYWNYVYLSQRLLQTGDPGQQRLLVEAIRHGSPISWQHINLLGEYDFSDERLEDSVGILPATWMTEQEHLLTEVLRP